MGRRRHQPMPRRQPVVRHLSVLAIAAVALLGASPSASAVSDEAILAAKPPRRLSAFGFFDDLAGQRPAEGVLPFAPATELYSDGALKRRFVYVPSGQAATYHPSEAFAFPVGSALIKTFSFPKDERRPGEAVRAVETRVLLRQEAGWQAWAYVWNADRSDADLKIAGQRITIDLVDAAGAPVSFDYAVPNKNQCKACHALSGEIVPLGPKARNLNGPLAYPDGSSDNQLARWRDAGLLVGLDDPAEADAVPDWRDAAAPLDQRARAWLDVNCAHCHRREGPASNSGLFLTWAEPYGPSLGIEKRPVAAGRGSGGLAFDIKPGDPDGSILVYRMESQEPGVMMPELGRSRRDGAAVGLLRDWISGLTAR